MKEQVLVMGAAGFIGSSFRRQSAAYRELEILVADRGQEVAAVSSLLSQGHAGRLSILNLAWPNMSKYASQRAEVPGIGAEWGAYLNMIEEVARIVSFDTSVRFFGIGSGIERYADDGILKEPYASYVQQKRQMRTMLESYFGERLVWLRFHYLFGPHEQRKRFVPAALLACRNGQAIKLSKPERLRHWLHVDDAAAGLVKALLDKDPQDWDLCGPHALTFAELCQAVETVAGRSLHVENDGQISGDSLCRYVQPTAVPDFMLAEAGSFAQITVRFADYNAWLS